MAVPRGELLPAVRVGVLALVVVLAGLTVLSGLLDPRGADGSSQASVSDWFRGAVSTLAASVRAPVHAGLGGDAGIASLQVEASIVAVPLTLTAVLVVVVALLVRRSRVGAVGGEPLTLVTQAATVAGSFALGATVVAAAAAGPVESLTAVGLDTDVSVSLPGTLVGCFVLAAAAALLGLASRSRGPARFMLMDLTRRMGPWPADLRRAALLAGTAMATALAVLLAVLLWQLAQAVARSSGSPAGDPFAGSSGGGEGGVAAAVAVIAVGMAYLPSLLAYAGGAAMGGTLRAAGDGELSALGLDGAQVGGDGGVGLLAGGLPLAAVAVPVVLLLVVTVVGARWALTEAPATAPLADWWRLAAVHALLWAVLVWVTTASVEVSGGGGLLGGEAAGSASGVAGLGLPSTVLVAFAWGVAAVVVGRLAARPLAATYPVVAWRLVAPSAHPHWRLLLADAVAQADRPVPFGLREDLDALHQGSRPDAERLSVRPGLGRRAALLAGIGVGAALVLAVGYLVVSATAFGPARTVQAYFDALDRGDAQDALAHLDPALLDGRPTALLTDEALADAAVDTAVGDARVSGDEAVVDVTVDGTTTTYRLQRDGRTGAVFPRWRLVTALDHLEVEATGELGAPDDLGVRVNGTDVPAAEGSLVFPGRYAVTASAAYPWRAEGSEVVAVGGGGTTFAAADVSLDPAIGDDADAAVAAYLDECARSTQAEPEGCPFGRFGEMTDVEWTVVEHPTVAVSGWDGTSFAVTTRTPGQVALRAVSQSAFFGPEAVDTTESVWVRGSLDYDDAGEPVFEASR